MNVNYCVTRITNNVKNPIGSWRIPQQWSSPSPLVLKKRVINPYQS